MSCCTFSVFMDDFNHYFTLYFDVPPTAQQLKNARSDWRAGNTGYEAAHNAKNRAKDAAAKALEKPLVHIGGRHFAYEGFKAGKAGEVIMTMHQKRNAALISDFYKAHGPCCAGCDWWRFYNSMFGECIKTVPVSGMQRFSMLGITGSSLDAGAGHIATKRDHVCGEFKDEA